MVGIRRMPLLALSVQLRKSYSLLMSQCTNELKI